MNKAETLVHYIKKENISPLLVQSSCLAWLRFRYKNDCGIWFYIDRRLEVGRGSWSMSNCSFYKSRIQTLVMCS